eukprot:CAMPEP_0115326458 /NCGR_PEP_ID=MMETSP0270-20121206/83585_1 /TAXON_ID=71861 /ORGANISM="Scrippsiella trochoidea, Strain CCMP3099" /LENGTH=51 /DNA_ID=CAMNT_0002746769 /DNA_START=1 /DNA_END=153 /DNA_ORIENTATION=+
MSLAGQYMQEADGVASRDDAAPTGFQEDSYVGRGSRELHSNGAAAHVMGNS